MDKKLFSRLVESMGQTDEIVRGVRAPSREFYVDAAKVKAIRAITGLSPWPPAEFWPPSRVPRMHRARSRSMARRSTGSTHSISPGCRPPAARFWAFWTSILR